MSKPSDHIDPSVFQSLLDGELAGPRLRDAEGHLASCARCAAELEGWQVLFRELEGLPEILPSPRLRTAILAGRAARVEKEPLGVRILRVLRPSGPGAAAHVGSGRIQDFLEGLLPAGEESGLVAHARTCEPCGEAVSGWRTLLGRLDRLPDLLPSPGFAERVLFAFHARVVVAVQATGRFAWVESMVRGWIPSTRRGRVIAGTVAAAPGVGVLALFGAIAAHPLLTTGNVLTLLGWWASDAAAAVPGLLARAAAATPALAETGALALSVVSAPGMAIALLGAAWLTTMAAAWVVYRNVFAVRGAFPRKVGGHAR